MPSFYHGFDRKAVETVLLLFVQYRMQVTVRPLFLRGCCLMSSSLKYAPGLQRAVALTFEAGPEPVSSEPKQPHVVTESCPPMMTRVLMRFSAIRTHPAFLFYSILIESLGNASCFINILLFSDQSTPLENLINR